MKNSWFWNKGALALLCAMTVTGCNGQPAKNGSAAAESSLTAAPGAFILPEVPANLQSPEQRAAYVVTHYWDHFDFADTTMISKPEITEQAFADYLDLFSYTSHEVVGKSIADMLSKAVRGNQAMFDHFAELYEKYLDEPNSPFRQEAYFIAVLKAIIACEQVEEIYKVRPRYQLDMALKNRTGDLAADFEFVLRDGRATKLSGVAAEYVILFFNNPDCDDCVRVKKVLSRLTDPSVKVVAICPDQDVALWHNAEYPESWVNGRSTGIEEKMLYDLRAIPSLYLLDKQKRVILKDAPVEQIADWLDNRP